MDIIVNSLSLSLFTFLVADMQILIVFSHISYFVVSAVHILCIFINADPYDFKNITDNLNKP